MGLAKQRPPIVELKASATLVRVRQYPMSQEDWQGITPHIQRLIEGWGLEKVPVPMEHSPASHKEAWGN